MSTRQELIMQNAALVDPEPEYLYDPRRARRHYRTRRRHRADPGKKSYPNLFRGGYHFISRGGRRRYDPQWHGYGRRAKGVISKLSKIVLPGSFVVALIGQGTKNDIWYANQHGFDSWTFGNKLRFIGGTFLERVTLGSVNVIPDLHTLLNTGTSKPTFEIASCLNPYTYAGIASFVYSKLPFNVPYKGLAKKLGVGLAAGGILGGLLDEPPAQNPAWASGRGSIPAPTMISQSGGSVWK